MVPHNIDPIGETLFGDMPIDKWADLSAKAFELMQTLVQQTEKKLTTNISPH